MYIYILFVYISNYIYIYLKGPSGHVICTILHPWQPSLLYKMEGLNPWACAFDFVQQACPTPAGAHPAYQRYLSTLHLCPFSPLPRLGHHRPPSLLYKMGGGPTLGLVCLILYSRPVPHKQTHQQDPVTTTKIHRPPSLLYKMGWPNPWTCVSDFLQQACPTQASTPARPSHIHQVPPHPTCQSYPSTLHLCPLSHLPSLGHHWPPSLLYKMGWPNPWACVSDFVQ